MYIKDFSMYLYVEQREYNSTDIPKNIRNKMREYGFMSLKGDKFFLKATGFFIFDSSTVVIFPKGYKFISDISKILDDIRLLFSVLIKYQQTSTLSPLEVDLLSGGNNGQESGLLTAYKLIEDYKSNGLLKRREITETNKFNANITWSKTLSKVKPIFSNKQPIYSETVCKKNRVDENSFLVTLHKHAIFLSSYRFSWIMDIDIDYFSTFKSPIEFDTSEAVLFLEKELRSTFIQREVDLIKNILSIISRIDGEEFCESTEVLISKSYYYVWETMCGEVLDNQYSKLKSLIPQPKWYFKDTDLKKPVSQKPDILIVRNSTFYIIDAKEYDNSETIPGWPDIVKQFFYRLSIKSYIDKYVDDMENIVDYKNVFILPTYEKEGIHKLGSVSVPDVKLYGEIDAILLDARLVMRCYIGEITHDFMSEVESIVKL